MNELEPIKPKLTLCSWRSFFQFSLRRLLFLLTIVAVIFAWLNHHYRHHQREEAYLKQLTAVLSQTHELKDPGNSPDGTLNGMSELLVIAYDYQCKDDGTIDSTAACPTPKWLRRLLGEHFFHRVHSVTINSWDDSDQVDYDEFFREIDLSALSGIEALQDLKHLNLLASARMREEELKSFDVIENLGCLKSLHTRFPIRLEALNKLEQLEKLDIGKILVNSASPLICKLRSLRISGDDSVESLDWCGDLRNLRSLEVNDCSRLWSLSNGGSFSSLETVKVFACPLKDLRPLNNMPVKSLKITSCEGVERLFTPHNTESITNSTEMEISFPQLEHIELQGWRSPKLAINLDVLSKSFKLKKLYLSSWEIKEMRELTSLRGLEQIVMRGCYLPQSFDFQLPHLQKLQLSGCANIQTIEGQLPSLTDLKIQNCKSLKKIGFTSGNGALEQVHLEQPSDDLFELDCLSFAPNVKKFFLFGSGLTNLDCLANANRLESVNVERSMFVRDLSGLEGKSNLKELKLKTLPQLTRLNVSNLNSLEHFTVYALPKLAHLEGISNNKILRKIVVRHVGNLRLSCQLNKLPMLEDASIDESCLPPQTLASLRSLKKLNLQIFRGPYLIVDPD